MNDGPGVELNQVTINGAVTFGPNSTAKVGTVHASDAELRRKVAELQRALDERTDAPREVQEAKRHTQELADELAGDEPHPERVKKHWARLEPLLKALGAASSAATIAELVGKLS